MLKKRSKKEKEAKRKNLSLLIVLPLRFERFSRAILKRIDENGK